MRSQKFVYETEESKESESFIPAACRGAREELKSDDSIRMYINQNQSGNINFQDDTNISEKKLVEFMHSEDSLNAQLQSHESKSSLEIRKNDIKQKISDLRSRIGNVKFNFKDDSFDIKTDAAIKIQTHFRRYLAQKNYFSDSFSDEDKEVQKILSKITKTSPKKPLEIEIGSKSFSDIPSENPIHILSPKLSTIGPKLLEELKHLEETKTKKHEFKDILKDQLVWQESQMQNLQWLKEKELKELQAVTENLGHGPELQSVLSQIIENRYLHLTNLLVENIENVQEALTGDSDSIQKVEIVNEFSGISSRKEKSDQDSDRFLKKFKRGKFVDDINSESESILPEELEKIMHEMNQSENLKRIISEIEPANISVFEEEKQFSEVPSCVSGISGDNNEKPFYPDFDEIITDPDENEEFVHSIMLINESYKKFEADFLKNPNKDPEELISDFEQPNYKEFSDMELPSEDMIQELENAMNELINQTDPVLEINKRQPAKETSVEDPVTIDSPKIKAFSISPEPQIYKESRHRWNEILIEEGQSPEQTNFELKNEDSSILDDLQIPTPEPAVSITPENPFVRPSAPIHGSDSEEEKISNDFFPKFGKDYDELKTSLAFTPELLTAISESILQQLLSEDLLPRPRDISFIEMLPKEPMIRTDSISVQMYIDEIFDSASDDFLKNLKKPIKRNPLEILSKMQETDIGSLVEFTGPSPILNVNLYLNLEHPRDVINSDRSLTPNSMRLIKEAEHIHNKMIFDAANESLQQYRTYGLKGIPMPWSYTDRQMMPLLKNPDVIIVEVKKEIKKWSSIQAGKIPSRDMMLSDGILDEEILQQAREERLAAMLAEDVMEKDEVWVEYEFEETQAKLDLADMVLEQLVVESINILEA